MSSRPPPVKSFPDGKVPPYFIPHKRDQVEAFDENVQQLENINEERFFKLLDVNDNLLEIPDSPSRLSKDNFCSLVNDIAMAIKEAREHRRLCVYLFLTTPDFSLDFPDDDLLVFEDTEQKTPNGHVTGTKRRPDIIAAFEKDWMKDRNTEWGLIRLAGEKASGGKSLETQKKNAATYLHYLLLARPDFLVGQGLLITTHAVTFLVGIGGVGIKQFEVLWKNKKLYKFLYEFIYRLYNPSHFADSSYTRALFNKETSEVSYTLRFEEQDYPDLRVIHARNPFATRTHVLSNPFLAQVDDRTSTVFKEQLCQTGRRFDEWAILTKIHRPKNVPGVVVAINHEIVETRMPPEREKHRLGLRQVGSPFTTIPTAKMMLGTLFDLLEGI